MHRLSVLGELSSPRPDLKAALLVKNFAAHKVPLGAALAAYLILCDESDDSSKGGGLWVHSYRVEIRDRKTSTFLTLLTLYEENYFCIYCASGKRLAF